MKRITCLIDNNTATENSPLHTEHGLSFHIQWEDQQVICDVGKSALFAENAQALHINLDQVKQLVLSHGHKDHTGGLAPFIQHNETAEIIAAKALMNYHYYSLRHERKRDISTNRPLLQQHPHFVPVQKNTWINANMAIVFTEKHPYECPQANRYLTVNNGRGERLDQFEHEIALVIQHHNGLIIISSCSHNGVLNTLKSCQDYMNIDKVDCFIGGMHLIDDAGDHLEEITKHIQQHYPHTQFITGHCTGEKAIHYFKQTLSEQFTTFFSGWQLDF